MGDVSRTEVDESVEGRARPEPQSDRENERVAGPGRGAEPGSAGRPNGLGRASRWDSGIRPAREAAGGAPNSPAYPVSGCGGQGPVRFGLGLEVS